MNTKVRATVLSVDGSTITLSLESPYFTTLLNDEDVFVELQTIQGTRVEFHVPEAIVPIETIDGSTAEFVGPSDIVTDETTTTIGTDAPSSESIEPIKDAKSSKKK